LAINRLAEDRSEFFARQGAPTRITTKAGRHDVCYWHLGAPPGRSLSGNAGAQPKVQAPISVVRNVSKLGYRRRITLPLWRWSHWNQSCFSSSSAWAPPQRLGKFQTCSRWGAKPLKYN